MTKLLLTTALSCALALPALAATPAADEKLAENQELNFWMLDAIKTLDPQKNTDADGSDVLRQLFEGLMNEDATGAMVPGLAESHDVSADKQTYTFHLRDSKWSNGDPVTAGDLVFAWRRLADPATASEYAWYIELMNVENASAIVKGEMKPEELGGQGHRRQDLRGQAKQTHPLFPENAGPSRHLPGAAKSGRGIGRKMDAGGQSGRQWRLQAGPA